jgi:hypothetical protein
MSSTGVTIAIAQTGVCYSDRCLQTADQLATRRLWDWVADKVYLIAKRWLHANGGWHQRHQQWYLTERLEPTVINGTNGVESHARFTPRWRN